MPPFLTELFARAGKKVIEEIVMTVAAGAVIKAANDHGADVAKAAKDTAVKAASAAKTAGTNGINAIKKKLGKNKPE